MFTATLFRVEGPGGWTFVEVPEPPEARGPWGRTPVTATVDGVTWDTSVWTERSGRVLLPVPRHVRGDKGDGDEVTVTIRPRQPIGATSASDAATKRST